MRAIQLFGINIVVILSMTLFCTRVSAQDFQSSKTKYVQDTSRFIKAKALQQKARKALNRNDNQAAIDNYLASIEEYKSIYESALNSKDYELAINALLEKADIERRIYPNDTPYTSLAKARDLLNAHINLQNFLWFRTYLTYGRVAHTKADFYRATDYLDSAQMLYTKSVEFDSIAYRQLLEYKFYDYLYSNKSIDTVQKYIAIRLEWENEKQKKKPKPEEVLYVLQDYPDIYSQKGEYDIALAYAISNYKYFNQNRNKIKNIERYGEVYFDLSVALYRKDQLEKALEVALEYIDSNKSLIDNSSYANIVNLIGVIYNELDQPKKAIKYFEEFLHLPIEGLSETQIRISKATALLSMGINLYELGKTELARENYQKSLVEMKSLVEFPSKDLINSYRYLGDFYAVEELWGEALISYDSALRNTELTYTAPILDFPKSDSSSRFSLESLTILKKKTNALYHNYERDPIVFLEAVVSHVDKTHEKIRSNREDLYKSDGKLFLSQFFKDLYETGIEASFQLYEITGNDEHAWRAFQYAQMSKSNLFLEQEKDYKEFTSSDIPYSLKEDYYMTSGRLDYLKALLYNALDNSVTGDSVLRLSDQIIELEDKTSFLRDSISKNYSVSSLSDYQDAIVDGLESKSVLVEFFYGSKNVYSFGINSNKDISINKAENNDVLKQSLEGFLSIVASPPDYENFDSDLKGYRTYAKRLYDLLLNPVLKDMGNSKKELIIVPDEFLTRLPFEAFLVSDGEGKNYKDFDYLINSYNVRYLISSNVRKSDKSPLNNNYRILGIGFSESESNSQNNRAGYASLPGTEREIQFLGASFEGDYYLGEQGSRKRFLSDAKNYDIIHLAVHGKADSTNRFQSRLIFNGADSILNTNQLYLANIQAQLTVLSACESGKGQIESGEGTFSIARGFAIVGVPNVVMSLWEVNDRTTSSQMVKFYDNFLNKRNDLNSALRQVKLDYIKEGDSYLSHPYFWASFIHLGQNASFEKSLIERKTTLYGILGFLLLLAGLVVLVVKKRKGIQ